MMKFVKIYIIFLLATVSVLAVAGYDNQVIHPKLSGAAIEVYNNSVEKKITAEQIDWIIEGSIAEDTDPRYSNHFYNPQTGKGLNFWGQNFSAKEWAQKQNSVSGDYSEPAILKNYKEENYKRAYQGIGHIMHLVQDMSVPAHTRDDAHFGAVDDERAGTGAAAQ